MTTPATKDALEAFNEMLDILTPNQLGICQFHIDKIRQALARQDVPIDRPDTRYSVLWLKELSEWLEISEIELHNAIARLDAAGRLK